MDYTTGITTMRRALMDQAIVSYMDGVEENYIAAKDFAYREVEALEDREVSNWFEMIRDGYHLDLYIDHDRGGYSIAMF